MGAKLQALRELQEVELQIADIRRQLALKERSVAAQDRKLAAALATVEHERLELRKAQMELDGLDVDLKSRTEHLGKLREHLNSVRTNKEYAAVLSQLNTEKADTSKLESRALELLERVEMRKREFARHEDGQRAEAQRREQLRGQLEQTRQTFATRLGSLERQRDEAANRLDAETLKLFNRISERYDGEVLARIERTHPRRDEFTCGGCNMSLSAEVFNALSTRDEVLTCRNCGRILHYEKA